MLPKPPAERGKGGPSAETMAYWDKYFRSQAVEMLVFELILEDLRKKKHFQDVEAAVLSYLKHMPKGATPQHWMYGSLALAIRINGGKPERVRESLGFAAILAEASGNTNYILTVADLLFEGGDYEYTMKVDGKPRVISVGALIDEVAKKAPHRPQPILSSMTLARKLRDPKRMALAVEAALSLGWPGLDDAMRTEARKQAEDLADILKDDKRDDEADDLMARLASSSTRDLVVRLTWEGDADLDLLVKESLGATARHEMPRTVFGGAIIEDGKGLGRAYVEDKKVKRKPPVEVYSCPRAFDGDYSIRVEVVYQDPEKPPITTAHLEIITNEGARDEHRETRTVALPKPSIVAVRGKDGETKNLASADPLISAPVVIRVKNGRRTDVLPYIGTPIAAEAAPASKPKPPVTTPATAPAQPRAATPPPRRPQPAGGKPASRP